MAIIFDLDQTIIDTSCANELRSSRQWKQIYPLIDLFIPYDGVIEFMHRQHAKQKICIVSSSPRKYVELVISKWQVPIDGAICYHDTSYHKPHPDPHLAAMKLLQEAPNNIISIGDQTSDIFSAKAASIKTIGCLWGNTDNAALIAANPDFIAANIFELEKHVNNFFAQSCY